MFEEQEWAQEAGLVSLLSVPLSVRDRVIGVLNCYAAQQREFSDKERTLLLTLANQTALAIENAHLITNTAVVREMHHRIKNNLQTIAMLMQMQVYETELPATRHALETNIHRIHSIASVHEVLSEKGFRLVDVKDVIDRITREMATTMIAPGQDIKILVHGQTLLTKNRLRKSWEKARNSSGPCLRMPLTSFRFSGQMGRSFLSIQAGAKHLVTVRKKHKTLRFLILSTQSVQISAN